MPDDLSVDNAIDALKGVSSEAPDAAPEDNDETIIDDKDDDEDEDQDADGDDADGDEDNGAEDSSDSDAEGEDGPDEATDDAETGDKAEQSKTAIEPPTFLDATEREAFKLMPQAAQEILARQSKLAQADYSRKTQANAEAKKILDARIGKLREVKTEREKRMDKWSKVDWAEQATKLSPQQFNKNRAIYEKELGEYQAIQTTLKAEEDADYEDHRQVQFAEIKNLAPQLIDGEKGATLRREVMDHVIKNGFTPERLKWMSAKEMVYVWKSLQWDKYQAEKSKKPPITERKNEKSKGKTIKPASRTAPPAGASLAVGKRFKAAPTSRHAMAALDALDVD